MPPTNTLGTDLVVSKAFFTLEAFDIPHPIVLTEPVISSTPSIFETSFFRRMYFLEL